MPGTGRFQGFCARRAPPSAHPRVARGGRPPSARSRVGTLARRARLGGRLPLSARVGAVVGLLGFVAGGQGP
eukprot:2047100-Lingulodinium_polyedra.AAC.1